MRRLSGIFALTSVLVAVGALGPGFLGVTSVVVRDAEAGETEVHVGKDATPRKPWSSPESLNEATPWTPPEETPMGGRAGAAQRLAAGDVDAALASLALVAQLPTVSPMPERGDPAFEDEVVTRMIAGRALRVARRWSDAVTVLESLEDVRGVHKYVPVDVLTYELGLARRDL